MKAQRRLPRRPSENNLCGRELHPPQCVFLSVDLRIANCLIIRCKIPKTFFAFIFRDLDGFPQRGELDKAFCLGVFEANRCDEPGV